MDNLSIRIVVKRQKSTLGEWGTISIIDLSIWRTESSEGVDEISLKAPYLEDYNYWTIFWDSLDSSWKPLMSFLLMEEEEEEPDFTLVGV